MGSAFRKFGPLALAALAAGFSQVAPELIAQYPQAAAIISAVAIVLASLAPQPQKK